MQSLYVVDVRNINKSRHSEHRYLCTVDETHACTQRGQDFRPRSAGPLVIYPTIHRIDVEDDTIVGLYHMQFEVINVRKKPSDIPGFDSSNRHDRALLKPRQECTGKLKKESRDYIRVRQNGTVASSFIKLTVGMQASKLPSWIVSNL